MLLAHVTESRMRAPLDDPAMAGFVLAFDAVSRSARGAAGFRWQLESEGRGHPVLDPGDGLRVLTVSVWADYPSLHGFVYRSDHGRVLLRRDDWFVRGPQPSTALWWTPDDGRPGADEAVARLRHLRRHGPTSQAFSLRRRLDREGRPERRR